MNIDELKDILQAPIFAGIDQDKLAKIIKSCEVKTFTENQFIYRHGEFGNECGVIIAGTARVEIPNMISKKNYNYYLKAGELVGVIALLTGYKRIANVIAFTDRVKMLVIPKNVLLELTGVFEPVKDRVNELYSDRVLYSSMRNLMLFASLGDALLNKLVGKAAINSYQKSDMIYSSGDKAEGLLIIRYGVVKIYEKTKTGKEKILAILKDGQYLGEKALLSDEMFTMSTNAVACGPAEIIKISISDFKQILESNPNIKKDIEKVVVQREERNAQVRADNYIQKTLRTVIDTGIAQTSSIILIDTTKCVHCGDCEKACAVLHQNHSRLIRKGFKLNNFLLIPTSCRLCDDPACMSQCPTNSIFKDFTGEIYHTDTCIGCGACAKNCPYGNITVAELSGGKNKKKRKKAATCDKCKGLDFFACVYNCATGAARRVDPSEYFTEITNIG